MVNHRRVSPPWKGLFCLMDGTQRGRNGSSRADDADSKKVHRKKNQASQDGFLVFVEAMSKKFASQSGSMQHPVYTHRPKWVIVIMVETELEAPKMRGCPLISCCSLRHRGAVTVDYIQSVTQSPLIPRHKSLIHINLLTTDGLRSM